MRRKKALRQTRKRREEAETCPICLKRIYDNSERLQLQCGHPFHKECVEDMKEAHIEQCPMCRAHVPELESSLFKEIKDEIKKQGETYMLHGRYWANPSSGWSESVNLPNYLLEPPTINNIAEKIAVRITENMFYTRGSIERYRRSLYLRSGPVEPEKRKRIGRDQRERILVQLDRIGELEERLASLGLSHIPENYVRRIQQIQEGM